MKNLISQNTNEAAATAPEPVQNAIRKRRGPGKWMRRQLVFVDEYLLDLNATQAAIRAGYSKKTATMISSRLLAQKHIADAVAAGMEERARRTGITQDRVLQELARIAFFDIRRLYREDGSLKRPDELDDDSAAVLTALDVVEMGRGMTEETGEEDARHVPLYTKKARTFDKNKALVNAMRHLGMLKDKVEHSGNVSIRQLLAEVEGTRLKPK